MLVHWSPHFVAEACGRFPVLGSTTIVALPSARHARTNRPARALASITRTHEGPGQKERTNQQTTITQRLKKNKYKTCANIEA